MTADIIQHLTDEVLVHHRLPTVGIEMAGSEFDGFAKHHAEGDFGDVELVGYFERLTNVISIFHKRLLGQGRIESFHKALTFSSTVDYYTVGTAGLSHYHTLTDTVDESFFRKGLDNA